MSGQFAPHEAGVYVEELQRSLRDSTTGLSTVPKLLKTIIEQRLWEERLVAQTHSHASFKWFHEFVTAPLPEGLHTDLQTLKNLCRDDVEAVDAIDRATKRADGNPHLTVDNINSSRPDGTSSARALRDLRAKAPELHGRVIAGELSPHAAMVQAGFRRKTVTVPVDPDAAARTILRHFDAAQRRRLIELLQQSE